MAGLAHKSFMSHPCLQGLLGYKFFKLILYIFIRLQILYILNMYVKFCLNRMLFTIWLINLFFIHNFRQKKKTLKS